MGIDLMQPLFLLPAVPALLLLVRWWRAQKQMPAGRKAVIVSLRAVIFLLLILSLAGVQLLFPVQEKTVVFVVDRSASMKDEPRAEAFLKEAVAQKAADDLYAVVAVGAQAVVDQPFTTREEPQRIGVGVNRHASNLADGIRLAAAMIPGSARGKVVLLTDGLATHGDVARETSLARARGIAVEAVTFQQPKGDEVLVTSVQVPKRLYIGEQFSIQVEAESTVATEATLRLYEGNREAGSQRVWLDKGKNRFLFTRTALEQGFHSYRVEVEAVRDTVQANNQGAAYVQVTGSPVVLVVEGTPGAAANLVSALEAGKVRAEVRDPATLPRDLQGYRQYSAIVLANVSATQLTEADMERIRTAVSDLGLGLVMTGGPDSFGMGGWFQTPIEKALPVHMDLRGKEQLPSLGLVLVIDKSGSMSGGSGADKMELAKEAAIRATAMLKPQDQIGVIAFDGTPWEVVAPAPVTDLKAIQQSIGGITADGGTDIYPALEMAYNAISRMNVQRKHIILLTDGQSGQANDYRALLQKITAENITVSTVAVGDDADTRLLETIAEWGKGRHYFTADARSIPHIFSKETALASRTFIVEQPQIPRRTGAGDWTALPRSLPPLRAYVAATPKQMAEVSLVSADDDPLLARWQYGLGRSVAWTSDLEGKWAPDWVNGEEMGRFWNEVVAWTFPQLEAGEWKTETHVDGGKGKVTVTLPAGATMPQQLEATVLNQRMERGLITLKPIAPGVWEGEFSAAEPGSYLIQIAEKREGRVKAAQTTGVTVPYSPEYALPADGEEQLRRWLEAGGGHMLTDPAEVFAGDFPQKWERQEAAEWLLMLAALLWPVDVAARRLPFSLSWRLPMIRRDQKQSGETVRRKDQQQTAGKTHGSPPLGPRGEEHWQPVTLAEDDGKTPSATAASEKRESGEAQHPAPADTFNRLLEAKKRKGR